MSIKGKLKGTVSYAEPYYTTYKVFYIMNFVTKKETSVSLVFFSFFTIKFAFQTNGSLS